MATLRFQSLNEASNKKPVLFLEINRKSVLFGSNVFNEKAMKQYLTSDALKAVQSAVLQGHKIDRKLADCIAMDIKEWALPKVVTHYTPWLQYTLIENVKGLKEIFGEEFKSLAKEQISIISEISGHTEGISSKVEAMTNERKKANQLTDALAMAEWYCNKIKPYFEEIRNHCDKLELLIDDETWTLTKYRELLFPK